MSQNSFFKVFIFICFCIIPMISFSYGNEDYSSNNSYIIQNLMPPNKYWKVKGGSCGEACLWSILRAKGISISQKKINHAGGNPGRGLHSHELFRVLKKYGVNYRNISSRVINYNKFLEKQIIRNLKNKVPVLLGVKIYPDSYPAWACDHFILLVGYDEKTNCIFYNSDNSRGIIKADTLLNKDNGYSIVSRHNFVFAIKFP